MTITIQDNTAFDPNNPPPFLSPSDYPTSGVGVSRTPTVGVRTRPQFGPPIPAGGLPKPELDFSAFGNGDFGQGAPQGPSGPAPSTPVQGNPLFNFLASLFHRSGGAAPQGMTGLLARGRGAPGTNNLGNPVNRF